MSSDDSGEPIILVRAGQKTLPSGSPILDSVDLSVAAGESLALIGRSGSGKSTLLACLGLLDRFSSGSYSLMGEDVQGKPNGTLNRLRGREIGFVFQKFFLLGHLNVMENVLTSFRHSSGAITRARRIAATEALESVGIASLAKRRPRQLSGGEQQRVAIARAIAKGPSLILADEPTGALDLETGEDVVATLLGIVGRSHSALIMVTHDIAIAGRLDAVAELRAGRVSTLDFHATPARHRWTQ